MNLTFKVLFFSVVCLDIIYVSSKSFDENMEEWNQVVPEIDFPVRCPEKGKHFAKIYYEDDFLSAKTDQPLSDNGIYIIRNVSLNDTNDFVCVYEEPEILPYTIHVMVIAGDPFDYLNHTQVFHPGVPYPTVALDAFTVVEKHDHLARPEDGGNLEKEEVLQLKDNEVAVEQDGGSEPSENDQEFPDELGRMSHDQLGDYRDYVVGPAVNTTGLVPPSMPTIKRVSPSCVQVSWTIKLNKGSPVSHYIVQHLQSLSTHGVGGGNFWIDSKHISKSTKWCKLDKLTPKYWYRFRISAVFYNNGQEIKVFGPRSDWLKLL